jgi:hypothetical protein
MAGHGCVKGTEKGPGEATATGRPGTGPRSPAWRYRACMEAGVEPRYEDHDGGNPWTFVVSRNLRRMHLTSPQRTMIAARMTERIHGSNQFVSKVAGQEDPSIDGSSLPAETLNEPIPTQAQAAELLNTSSSSVGRARIVLTHGIEELQQLVDNGKVSVYAAERVARQAHETLLTRRNLPESRASAARSPFPPTTRWNRPDRRERDGGSSTGGPAGVRGGAVDEQDLAAFLARWAGWRLVKRLGAGGQQRTAPRSEAVCVLAVAHQVHCTALR